MAVDAKLRGLIVIPKGSSTNVRALQNTTSKIVYTLKAGSQLIATGGVTSMADGKWYQVTVNSTTHGYVREDVVILLKPEDSEKIIQLLVKSDQQVFEGLARVSNLLLAAKTKGKNIQAQLDKFSQLGARLSARQNALKSSSLLKVQTGIKKAYTAVVNKMKSLISAIFGVGDGGVVSIPLSVVIIVTAAATLATTAALYYTFKPKYDESSTDLKMTTELEKALAMLEPNEAKKLKEDLEKQVDDAYNDGKKDGSFGGLGSILLYTAIGVGTFLVITNLPKPKNQ